MNFFKRWFKNSWFFEDTSINIKTATEEPKAVMLTCKNPMCKLYTNDVINVLSTKNKSTPFNFSDSADLFEFCINEASKISSVSYFHARYGVNRDEPTEITSQSFSEIRNYFDANQTNNIRNKEVEREKRIIVCDPYMIPDINWVVDFAPEATYSNNSKKIGSEIGKWEGFTIISYENFNFLNKERSKFNNDIRSLYCFSVLPTDGTYSLVILNTTLIHRDQPRAPLSRWQEKR